MKPATEEGGVTPLVYSCKEPVFAWTSITLSFFLFNLSFNLLKFNIVFPCLLSVSLIACDPSLSLRHFGVYTVAL